MIKNKKAMLIVLIILNSVVLLGQIYPAGVPPFAGIVNVVFLIFSLLYFVAEIKQSKKTK